MKAISLHQPWASAVAFGLKRIETRSWPTRHRGPIAIHAAAKCSSDLHLAFLRLLTRETEINDCFKQHMAFDFGDLKALPFGAIVATADLIDCLPITDDLSSPFFDSRANTTDAELALGNYTSGRYAWLLDNVRQIDPPIPFKGRQGIFTIPDSALSVFPTSVPSV